MVAGSGVVYMYVARGLLGVVSGVGPRWAVGKHVGSIHGTTVRIYQLTKPSQHPRMPQ